MKEFEQWNGFVPGAWQEEINVRDFIQTNYKEYFGDAGFLAGPTERTSKLMNKVQDLFAKERKNGGVLENEISDDGEIVQRYWIDNA